MSKVRYAPYVNKVLFQCFQIRICIKKFQDEKMEAMKEIRGEQNIQKEAILFTYQFLNIKNLRLIILEVL